MVNNGCGSNLTSDIPVRFTIYDNTNCAGSQVAQWTETFAAVNIPSGGGAQVFTITPQNITADLVANSTGCQISIHIEADYSDTICESDGTDNTRCSNKAANIPDLAVNSVATAVTCNSDGNLTGTTVNVSNDGCGDVADAVVRLTSDCGLTFADQTVNLTAGETEDVIFPFSAGITDCSCQFTAAIDPEDAICERDETDNTLISTSEMPIPDLEVDSDALVVVGAKDGEVVISNTVTLLNNGCGSNFTQDIPMRFTLYDDAGCSGHQIDQWTETFTGTDIESAGGIQPFTIIPHEIASNLCISSTNCQVSILAEADYDEGICEWDGTDNSRCFDKDLDIPDLTINSTVTPATLCDAGILRGVFTATVGNIGCGDANDAVARLTSDCDLGAPDQTVDLESSPEVTFSFTITYPERTCAFTTTVDPDGGVAECSGVNNSLLAPYDFACFPPVGGVSERFVLGTVQPFQNHDALYLPTRLRNRQP
jgi:hypothetical protein